MKKLTSIILATALALSTVGCSFALNGFSELTLNESKLYYEFPQSEAMDYVKQQMLSSKIKEDDIKILDLTTEEKVAEFLKANPKSEVRRTVYGKLNREILLIDKEAFNKYNVFNFDGTIIWYPLENRLSVEKDTNVKLTGAKGYALPYIGRKSIDKVSMGGFSVWKQLDDGPFYVPDKFQSGNNKGHVGIKTQVFIPEGGYVRVQYNGTCERGNIIDYFGVK